MPLVLKGVKSDPQIFYQGSILALDRICKSMPQKKEKTLQNSIHWRVSTLYFPIHILHFGAPFERYNVGSSNQRN